MDMLVLNKKPKSPLLITAFPGFGLVGTIAVEFLIEHLKTEQIGKIVSRNEIPVVAIHEGNLVEPISIHYSREHNLLLIRSVNKLTKNFSELSADFRELEEAVSPKEVLVLDGVNSPTGSSEIYYFSRKEKLGEKYKQIGLKKLVEGIVIGAPAMIISQFENSSCIFAETHSDMPDSRSAAELIKALDRIFNLKVDYTPLYENAKKFEAKLRQLEERSRSFEEEQDRKRMNYVG
ncbi:MAG: PAC2 family protein [Candidatus Woesearchaeota archaeon]